MSSGVNDFKFTVITIHTKPERGDKNDNTKAEINSLHTALNIVINHPHCFSGNAILMGDFNQGIGFIPLTQKFQSQMDQLPAYRQLEYDGGSTAAATSQQKHDR